MVAFLRSEELAAVSLVTVGTGLNVYTCLYAYVLLLPAKCFKLLVTALEMFRLSSIIQRHHSAA